MKDLTVLIYIFCALRTLQKIELPIVNMSVCSEFYETVDYTFQMCAGSEIGMGIEKGWTNFFLNDIFPQCPHSMLRQNAT